MRSKLFITAVTILIVGVTGVNAEITEVGHFDTEGEAHGVKVVDGYAFVADRYDGLVVIDISDPEDPQQVGSCDTPDDAFRVLIVNNLAYVCDYRGGLRIIDISDPEHLEEIGYYDNDFEIVYSVDVAHEFAFLAMYDDGLRILDISDPGNPNEVSTFDTPGETVDVVVEEDYAYLADNNESNLLIVDISDPENPDLIGECDLEEYAVRLSVIDDYIYVTDYYGLRIVDISDPENPHEVGNVETEGDTWGIDVKGEYAFIADDVVGLVVVDISDPENPDIAETFETEGEAVGVFISGNHAYVAAIEAGLRILDVTEYIVQGPSIFLSTESIDFGEIDFGTSADSTLIISNRGNDDLLIMNISVEGDYFTSDFEDEFVLEPGEESELLITFSPLDPGEFEGEIVIASNDQENEETTIDVSGMGINSPPTVEIPIGDVETFEDAGSLELALLDTVFSDPNGEELVFSAIGNDELGISISDNNILSLEPVANYNTSDGDRLIIIATDRYDASVRDTLLVVINPINDLPTSFTLIEPADSSEVSDYPTVIFRWTESHDVVEGDTVTYNMLMSCNDWLRWYRGIGDTTLEVSRENISVHPDVETLIEWTVWAHDGVDSLRCEQPFSVLVAPLHAPEDGQTPVEFSLDSIFPNPFNSSTIIRYDLPSSGNVELAVFDVNGRLVDELVKGELSAGRHIVELDASGLAAGVYFVVLRPPLSPPLHRRGGDLLVGGTILSRRIQKAVVVK